MLGRTIRLYRSSYAGLSKDVWILTLILFVNRTGAMVIPFLTVLMTTSKGFTLLEAGYMMSAFGLGSVVGTTIGGKLTDTFNPFPVMFWSLVFTGLVFFSLLFIESFWGFCLVFFLLSSVSDAYRPANNAALSFYSKPENYTRSFGLLRLAANLGFAFGPGLGGFIIAFWGYDSLFIVDGITCLFAAVAMYYFLDQKKIKAKKEEKKKDEKAAGKEEGVHPAKDKYFLFFISMNFLVAMGFFQLFTTVPVYLKDVVGFSEQKLGGFMFVNGLLIAALEMPMVFSIENKYKTLDLISFGTILYGIAFLSFQLPGMLQITPWVFIVLLSIAEIYNMPFTVTWASQRASAGTQGRYMGYFGVSWSIAMIVGPTLSTYIAEAFSFSVLWYFSAALCIAPGLGYLWLKNQDLDKKLQTKKPQ